jgi:gamma-glutamyltranspeptidase / glutathione hydrolase
MNLLDLPYPSYRLPVVAARCMVATTQPLAARAGLAMMEAGGSAVDAAIAAAAMLTVVEATSNGIGGDAFALVWDGNRLHGLNGSGRAPEGLSVEVVRAQGHEEVPAHGWLPVTVPGAPRAWKDLHQRFGRLAFEQVLAPAIETAERGFAVTPVVAYYWQRACNAYRSHREPEFAGWMATFAPGGHAPAAGELWRQPDMSNTLRRIARSGGEDFYEGELAGQIVRFARDTGGYLSESDLAGHHSTWVQPVHARYRDHEVWEIPPSGQGLAALVALNILNQFDMKQYSRESVDAYHLQIEAMKLAFADAYRYIADPEHVDVPVDALLSQNYATERGALITEQAQSYEAGEPVKGGTVYLCTADEDGMMVSFIQSNYMGFGSGIVIPGTGISMQNRGANFSLDPAHPNVLAPRKRPYHTIIPGFLTREGKAVGPFGVMGGFMQPQGHLQVVLNTVDWGLNPQASLDAPRWRVDQGREVRLEETVARPIVEELIARGHEVTVDRVGDNFGRGQIIWRLPSGSLAGGSESRADGLALGL